MAPSGTVSTTTVETREVIDAAFDMCGVVPQKVTAEQLEKARSALFTMLSAVPTRVYPLWARDHKLVTMPEGQMAITLPQGTVDVGRVFQRNFTRYETTETAGADRLMADFSYEKNVALIGLSLDADVTKTITFEWSNDDVTWTAFHTPGSTTFEANVLQWFEIDPTIDAQLVRVRETTAAALSVDRFILGGEIRDLPLTRLGHDSYVNQNNRQHRAARINQYWVDRKYDNAVLMIYPTADEDAAETPLSVWRQRHIMDVGELSGTLEVPQRWLEALQGGLAWRIALRIPQIDRAVVQMLKPIADEWTALVAAEERDSAPMTIRPNLRGYRRR